MNATFSVPWLLVAGMALSGCSQLWGGSATPSRENCVATPDSCSADQYCNSVTEACEPVLTSDMGSIPDLSVPLVTPPTSFIFPGGSLSKLDFPRDSLYSIEAQGTATIYYTLDGSEPTPGMTNTQMGKSPVSLGLVPANSIVKWSADYGAGYALDAGHVFSALNTNASPQDFGFIPEPAVFDLTGGSVVTVAAGTSLTGSVRFQAWRSTATGYCPGCIIQFVVTADTVGAAGCLNTVTGYGSYPGQVATVPFAFNAPMTPGRYPLYTGLTLQFSCDGSIANGIEVGEVIVK